jgi:hypothetical protein
MARNSRSRRPSIGGTSMSRRRWLVSSGLRHDGELIHTGDLTWRERGLARMRANRLWDAAAWSGLDPRSRAEIARLLGVHASHPHDGELARAAFARAVTEGTIVGLRFEDAWGEPIRPRRLPSRERRAGGPGPSPPARKPAGQDARLRDWIALELVDEDGLAVSGEPLVFHLPDGSERQGRTDAGGYLREPTPAGEVFVTFAGLEAGAWLDGTEDDLRAGLTRRSGAAHRIVLPARVVLALAWNEEVVRALPRDAVLRLVSDRHGTQERRLGDAGRRDGQVHVAFSWRGQALRTRLELVAGGRRLSLWPERAIARDPPAPWELALTGWLGAGAETSAPGAQPMAALPEDQGPVDERMRGPRSELS